MNEIPCSHPAQLRGADGQLRCLTCGEVIKPEKPAKKPKDEKNSEE